MNVSAKWRTLPRLTRRLKLCFSEWVLANGRHGDELGRDQQQALL